jgi:hypothetical protein
MGEGAAIFFAFDKVETSVPSGRMRPYLALTKFT